MIPSNFGETLPSQCPPDETVESALNSVYRLTHSAYPDEACFASKMALGIPQPDTFRGTPCEWASCSLNVSIEALLKIRGLRRRNKFVATLDIPAEAGRHMGDGHIHFWKYKGFDISSSITEVQAHGL